MKIYKFLSSIFLFFQLASGEVFGPDQPIALKLLGSERSIQALEGVFSPCFIYFKDVSMA